MSLNANNTIVYRFSDDDFAKNRVRKYVLLHMYTDLQLLITMVSVT